jgi:predicted lipase
LTNICLVAFRGTVGIKDWEVDFKIERNSLGLHKGFCEAVDSLYPEIRRVVAGKDVLLTGHSLGAAMAAVAAIQLRTICEGVRIVNFGQPKIGDDKAVKLLNGILWNRFVHGEDIVTHVPLKCLDYVHGGKEIHIPQQRRPWWGIDSRFPYFNALIPRETIDHVPTWGYGNPIWKGIV